MECDQFFVNIKITLSQLYLQKEEPTKRNFMKKNEKVLLFLFDFYVKVLRKQFNI